VKSAEVREAYLKFFESKGHTRVPSDSLVPGNDPTLMFTSAGMVQFKPLYVAKDKPYVRATSCQRCLRTTDIERVGMTARHLTFFEMLGNFSFGDYFKEGAIAYAWEFLTDKKYMGMDPARLHMSVFEKDEEAVKLWSKYPLKNPIVKFGDEDNYWPAGSALKTWAGPNGACSEIYFDFGPEFCAKAGFSTPCGKPGDHECDRFREIWNLVFPQFVRDPQSGENPPMARPGIDTGMGLERMCSALQGKDSVFDIDIFADIISQVKQGLEHSTVVSDADMQRSHKIIADHTRAATFMVADGIVPSNEGRGYILRRLIRRATRQTALYGKAFPIVARTVPRVVALMGAGYPELIEREARVIEIIRNEEERFVETLQRGLEELEKERSADALSGDRAFYLYDTFGFPRELTEDIWTREMKRALAPGFEGEYAKAMEAQQERARAAWKGSGARALGEVHHALAQELGATRFTGYGAVTGAGKVAAIVRTGGDDGKEGVRSKTAAAGETVELILDATPLYAESGGQVADRGRLAWEGGEAEVLDVQKPLAGMFIHTVRVAKGALAEGAAVTAQVDAPRRMAAERHHTATHLLHAALHRFVGKQATQAGSLVAPDRLRFDFMSQKALEPEVIRSIAALVNEMVVANHDVTTSELSLDEAKKKGAMMLFSEKYGAKVRMVEIADVSRELCGGTHVRATGGIGPFVLVAESAVASGVRRIEAVSGRPALAALAQQRETLERAAGLLRCPPRELEARIQKLLDERRELEQAVKALKSKDAAAAIAGQVAAASEIGGVKVLITEAPATDPAALRDLADRTLDKLVEGIVVLGSRGEDTAHLLVRVSKGLVARVNASDVVRAAAGVMGGTGGGKPDMAQAGGKEPAKLPEALERARTFLSEKLGG